MKKALIRAASCYINDLVNNHARSQRALLLKIVFLTPSGDPVSETKDERARER